MIKTHNRREMDMTQMGPCYAISTSAPEVQAVKETATSSVVRTFLEGFFPRETFYSDAVERFNKFSAFVNNLSGETEGKNNVKNDLSL